MADAGHTRHYPPKPADVYFFATCLVDQFTPEAGLDAVRLIEREGIRVHVPADQTCCGQPAYTSGYLDEARAVARRQFELFPESWPIVVPSGSCAGMMRHHYPKLFADDPVFGPQARALAERIFEFTEFLVHVAGFRRDDRGNPCTVALHTSCSARREMHAHETGHALLAQLSHVQVVRQEHEEECCGFGGTFSIRHSGSRGGQA
jgi:L-lactate dehydrogenase complex protein LldE